MSFVSQIKEYFKEDQKALILSGFVFFLCLMLLIFDYSPFNPFQIEKNQKIGTLVAKSQQVKRKFEGAVGWEEIGQDESIFKNDQIFTHDKSSAEILLLDETVIKVAPNSLIKLEQNENELNVELQEGFLFAKIGHRSKGLKIKSGDKTFETGESEAEFQIADGTVSVAQGNLVLKVDGKEVSLGQDQYMSLLDGTVKSFEISPLSPVPNSYLYFSQSGPVDFKWKSKVKLESYQILISKDVSFKEIVADLKTKQGEIIHELVFGGYYWKVLGFNNQDGGKLSLGPTSFFELKEIIAPKLLSPRLGEIIEKKVGDDEYKINFAWEDLKIGKYQVQLEYKENGKLRSKTLESPNNQMSIKLGQSGEVAFRVSVADGEIRQWSEWRTFYLGEIEMVKDLTPEDLAEVDKTQNTDFSISFSWGGARGFYQFEISKTPDFEENVISERIQDFAYRWRNPPLGRYYWRVGPWSSKGIKFSPTHRLDVTAPGPIIISPPPNIELTLMSPHETIKFNWEVPKIKSQLSKEKIKYVLEIAKDKDFEDLVEDFETHKLSFEWKEPELGSFYWRVRPIFEGGVRGQEAKAGLFIKKPLPPRSPPIAPEIELEIRKKEKGKRTGGREVSSISNTFVSLNFPELNFVKQYEVEIYEDRNLSDLVMRTTLETREFIWDEPDAGVFYLRYAVVDAWGQQSDWSDLSKLTLFYDLRLLDPPELDSPDNEERLNYDPEDEIDFEWDSVHWAQTYELQVGTDPGLGGASFSQKTKETSLEIPLSKLGGPGVYYWKVVAQNGKMIKTTKVRSIYLINPEPELTPEQKLQEEMEEKEDDAFIANYKRLRTTHLILHPGYSTVVWKQTVSNGVSGYSGDTAINSQGGQIRYQSPALWSYELSVLMLKTNLVVGLVNVVYNDYQFLVGKGIPFSSWIKFEPAIGLEQLTTTSIGIGAGGNGLVKSNDTYRSPAYKLVLDFYTEENRYHHLEYSGAAGTMKRNSFSYIYNNTFWSGPITYQLGASFNNVTYTSPNNTKGDVTVGNYFLGLGTRF